MATFTSPNLGEHRPSRSVTAGYVVMLVAGCAMILLAGPAPQLNFPADVSIYLDAADRCARGQSLDRDFFCPIGPGAILPTVLAMRWGILGAAALAGGSALVWTAFGIIAWFIARPRMNSWIAAGFSLFVAATAAAPYALDFGSWQILSYGMLYNRLAWSVVILVCAYFLTPASLPPRSEWSGAVLGMSVVWLWAIKPNYLLILVPITAFVWLAQKPVPLVRTLIAAALAGGLTLGFIWSVVPFDLVGCFREQVGMAREAPEGLLIYTLARSLKENALVLGALLICAELLLLGRKNAAQSATKTSTGLWRLLVLPSLVPATFAANVVNCQFSEFPLWGALGWIIASWAAPLRALNFYLASALVVGVALGVSYAWQPLASIPYALAWNRTHQENTARAIAIDAPAYRSMPMRFFPGESHLVPTSLPQNPSAGTYAAWLNDGLRLLASSQASEGAILCLDWNNPFSFARGSAPIRGDQVAWHVGRTIGSKHHPDPDSLLEQAALVLEPKSSVQPESLAFKRALFSPKLEADFAVSRESSAWRLWVRRSTKETRQGRNGAE